MRVESLVISNFYNNPDEVRQYMLSQPFDVKGNYPGSRTRTFLDDNIKHTIQEYIRPFAGEVTFWGDAVSGAFQITTAADRSWIHTDWKLATESETNTESHLKLFRYRKFN